MKKKFKLENLKVKSFITDEEALNSETIQGGNIVIPVDTYYCTGLFTQNCPTRFAIYCNQVTQLNCVTDNTCDINTIQVNCNNLSQLACIRPTVVGPTC